MMIRFLLKKEASACADTSFSVAAKRLGRLPHGESASGVLGLLDDGLECFGLVHSQVGKDLAVDLDASLVDGTHQLRVAHAFETSGSVDTLNPQGAEVALLVLTIAVSVGQTLLPSVL